MTSTIIHHNDQHLHYHYEHHYDHHYEHQCQQQYGHHYEHHCHQPQFRVIIISRIIITIRTICEDRL